MTKKEYDMKIEKAMNRYYDTLEKCNPFNVKSAYVTCRSCGSKLNREYMAKNYLHVIISKIKCPVCNSEAGLYSKLLILLKLLVILVEMFLHSEYIKMVLFMNNKGGLTMEIKMKNNGLLM